MWEWDVDVTVADFGYDVSVTMFLAQRSAEVFP